MSKRKRLIEIDPEKLGGTPVFYWPRVPVQTLFGANGLLDIQIAIAREYPNRR